MSLFYKTFVIVYVFGFPQASYANNSIDKSDGGSCFLNSTGKKTALSRRGVSDWLTIAYS